MPDIVRGFDHAKSELVDVFPNPEGEFVQVWDSPKGTPSRRLLLAYQRGEQGVSSVTSEIYLDDGPWGKISVSGDRRTFYYRESRDVRAEWSIPSGRWLVSDPREGISLRVVFTADFDWDRSKPKGRALRDKGAMKRQMEDLPWFKSTYQERTADAGGTSSELVLVEEHRGRPRLLRVGELREGEVVLEQP